LVAVKEVDLGDGKVLGVGQPPLAQIIGCIKTRLDYCLVKKEACNAQGNDDSKAITRYLSRRHEYEELAEDVYRYLGVRHKSNGETRGGISSCWMHSSYHLYSLIKPTSQE